MPALLCRPGLREMPDTLLNLHTNLVGSTFGSIPQSSSLEGPWDVRQIRFPEFTACFMRNFLNCPADRPTRVSGAHNSLRSACLWRIRNFHPRPMTLIVSTLIAASPTPVPLHDLPILLLHLLITIAKTPLARIKQPSLFCVNCSDISLPPAVPVTRAPCINNSPYTPCLVFRGVDAPEHQIA